LKKLINPSESSEGMCNCAGRLVPLTLAFEWRFSSVGITTTITQILSLLPRM